MKGFDEVCAFLPPGLRLRGQALPAVIRRRAEELRLRAGREPTVVLGGDELPLPGEGAVTVRDLELTVEAATRSSAYAALERLRQGWFTLRGGHRMGLCGSLWTEDGRVRNLRQLSSLNLRIAHAVPGCGEGVLEALTPGGSFSGALLISPPGGGKTTLLRDLCRLLSDGLGVPALRVGLCDERGELAALWEGVPQFDVGGRTDVLEGCPKAQGLLMLLRGMNPQVICCDEITDPADCAALAQCGNCGVKLLCTAHARDRGDLLRKPLYRGLLEKGLFEKIVVLNRWTTPRYQVEGAPLCGEG